MRVEIRINGHYHLELSPETDIEKLVIEKMMEGASKGKAVKLVPLPEGDVNPLRCMDVSVEVAGGLKPERMAGA